MGEINGPDIHQSISIFVSSPQSMELTGSINLLQLIHMNVVPDSVYVVGLFPAIETGLIPSSHAFMLPLLQELL